MDSLMNEMNPQLTEQFKKLIGSFVLYSTYRAGFVGSFLRQISAPYVRRDGRKYAAATSGLDLAVGLVSTKKHCQEFLPAR